MNAMLYKVLINDVQDQDFTVVARSPGFGPSQGEFRTV